MNRFELAMVIGVMVTTVGCMPGRRLLRIQIEVDGVTTLDAMGDVADVTPVNQMWDVLSQLNFHPTDASRETEAGDPWTLRGDIRIRISHTDNELTSCDLTSLSLQRNGQGSDSSWSLSDDEVARIKLVTQGDTKAHQ